MYVPPLLKMLCKLTHVTVVLSPVWLCCFIYDSMVWFCSRRLALSYTHTSLLNHPICYLSSLFMRFLEWLVTSFSFSFVYMLILSFHWWCIMIVLKWHLFAATLIYDVILGAIKPATNLFSYIYRNFQCIVTISYACVVIYP